jgi:hypothetical protein
MMHRKCAHERQIFFPEESPLNRETFLNSAIFFNIISNSKFFNRTIQTDISPATLNHQLLPHFSSQLIIVN